MFFIANFKLLTLFDYYSTLSFTSYEFLTVFNYVRMAVPVLWNTCVIIVIY